MPQPREHGVIPLLKREGASSAMLFAHLAVSKARVYMMRCEEGARVLRR